MSKVKLSVDLAQLFVEQYKFNNKIAPDRKLLQRMSKKASKSFRKHAQRQYHEALLVPALAYR